MDILTYRPAIIVIAGSVLACIYLFWKWLRGDAEKNGKTQRLKIKAKGGEAGSKMLLR